MVAGLPLSGSGSRVPKQMARIALTGRALRRACRMMIRLFDLVGSVVHDHPVRFPSARCDIALPPARPRGRCACVGSDLLDLFGGSDVMQAMNPANSRAIAVTTTCLGLPFAIM